MPNWEVMDEAALAAADGLRGALDSGVKFVKLKSGATADKYGSNPMRILPKHVNMISWYHPVPTHFGIATGASIGCARLLSGGKEQCAACEHAFAVMKIDEKRGKKLLPGWSAYMNVLLLKPDGTLADNRVQVLSVRTGVLDQIRDAFEEKGDITHPLNGRNINLKKKGENLTSEYIVQVADPTPIPVDDLDTLEVIDLTQVTEFLDDATMRKLISSGGGKPGNGDAFADVEKAPPSRQLAPGGFAEEEEDPGPGDDEAPADDAAATDEPADDSPTPAGGFAENPDDAPAAAAPAAKKATKTATKPAAPRAPAPPAPSGSPAADALARLRSATAKK